MAMVNRLELDLTLGQVRNLFYQSSDHYLNIQEISKISNFSLTEYLSLIEF